MKYINQINILLAGVGIIVVVYTFSITFFASQPADLIWVEPGKPAADLDTSGRRIPGTETPAAFRGSVTSQTSAIETLPADRGRTRSGFQASQPTAGAGPRTGFTRPSSASPAGPNSAQRANELNRIEVGRSGGVMPMTQSEQFNQPPRMVSEPSRIGDMNGSQRVQEPQPTEGAKRDASTDPPPPPVRSSNQ